MLAGSLTFATRQGASVTVRNEDGRNKLSSTTGIRNDQNKTKRQLVANRDYSTTANCREKFPAIFRDCYLFIPRFLAEPLTTFCETLVGKHRNKPTNIILGTGTSDRATSKTHALADSFYKFIRTYFMLIFNIKFKSGREKDYNSPKRVESTMYI